MPHSSFQALSVSALPRSFRALARARLTLAMAMPVVVVLVVLAALAQPSWPARAAGAIWYVAQGGTGPNCTQAAPCGSIQTAADLASNGDEIRVAQGAYMDSHTRTVGFDVVTQTVFLGKSLTLRGGYTDTDWMTSHLLGRPTILDARAPARRPLGASRRAME